mmetsp:Transcript_9992/g.15083  ORF Transcript_9992/g.15083 Transcript_9992/m.15083 type:complete len:263 (+) Transcript_9992:93-881(+)
MDFYATSKRSPSNVYAPFTIHTASDTLVGRSDIRIPPVSPCDYIEKDAACSTAGGHEADEHVAGGHEADEHVADRRISDRHVADRHRSSGMSGQNQSTEEHKTVPKHSRRPEYRETRASLARAKPVVKSGRECECSPGYRDAAPEGPAEESRIASEPMMPSDDKSCSASSVSPADVFHRQNELWKGMIKSLQGLADLGYDRTMVFSILPVLESRILDSSVEYVYQRLQKRVSKAWQQDEPADVVVFSREFIRCYEEMVELYV